MLWLISTTIVAFVAGVILNDIVRDDKEERKHSETACIANEAVSLLKEAQAAGWLEDYAVVSNPDLMCTNKLGIRIKAFLKNI